MAKTTPEELAIVSAIQERAAAEASAKAVKAEEARDRAETTGQPPDEGGPATTADVPRVSRLLTKTIIVATAAMLLCGAVTVVSVLTTVRSPRLSPSTPTVGPTKVAGLVVVRPALLNRQLAAGLPTTTRPDGTAVIAGDLVQNDDVRAERLSGPVQAIGTNTANPRAEEIRKTVYDFYTMAPATPEKAFELLGPEMTGDGVAGFAQSWDAGDPEKKSKLLVQVSHLMVGHGGVVFATVAISWPDGTVLRTEQLLVVSEAPNPKIVRAELFSGHRD
jgi:hypothetical protein